MQRLYFDNAATSLISEQVAKKMFDFLKDNYGNPSSIHSYGRKAKVVLEEAREICADSVNANPSEIYFTSGGTEANNFLIKGIACAEFEESGRKKLLTSKVEHKSVLDSFEHLLQNGFEILYADVNENARVKTQSILSMFTSDFSLVSLMFINNETGAINDIEELAKSAHSKNIYFHTDAVQAFGKIKIDVKQLGVDALSVSAHKIGGPKGTGFAYIKTGTPIQPLIHGGSQERNKRGGTENIAGIIGFAEAIKLSNKKLNQSNNYINNLKLKLKNSLARLENSHLFFNEDEFTSSHILSVTLDPAYYHNNNESILMYLDINGIAVSSGSACTSGTLKPSHVILGSGRSKNYANGTIRFSFGERNTEEEINYVVDVMEKMLKKFKMQ